MLLLPTYALLRLLPATRDAAERLGLVTQAQMTAALLDAVANAQGLDGRGAARQSVSSVRQRCAERNHDAAIEL